MKIVCCIPTFNCEPQIVRVLNSLKQIQGNDISEYWIIDNGSMDATVAAASNWKKINPDLPLRIFQNRTNVSLGGTHKIAWRKARSSGATHLIIFHGDDQGLATDIPKLISISKQNHEKTVLGSRFLKDSNLVGYRKSRVFGNLILNAIYSAITGKRLSDLGSGLNLFAIGAVPESSLEKLGNSLTFNYEVLLELIRSDVPFLYAPITWSETDQTSNARNYKVFTRGIKILVFWRLGLRLEKNNQVLTSDVETIEL